MFQALFNSLSGLFSFSRSLDTLSNNIANMNTPGFRGSDSFFSSVGNGNGVQIAGEGMRDASGALRQTGNIGDLAIVGDGYFVLIDDEGNQHYTRSGQFRFDEEGKLTDVVSGYRVLAFDAQGTLAPVDFDDYRTIPAQATTSFSFVGNISPGSTTTNVGNMVVYDSNGASQTLSVTFTNNTANEPGSYVVTFKDAEGNPVGTPGKVVFGPDGTPLAGFSELSLSVSFGGTQQTVKVKFGSPGARDGMTALTGLPTAVTARADDGHGVLNVTSLFFDDEGVMQLVYSQGEKRQGPRIALASLPNSGELRQGNGALIDDTSIGRVEIGRAGQGRFGRIAGGSLEMSNVDLTQEFAEMIIIQRGYQASSRVMSVSNEMIEQLYKSSGG